MILYSTLEEKCKNNIHATAAVDETNFFSLDAGH